MISLTQEERDRFAAWLEQDARSSNILAEQAAKLPGPDFMGPRLRQEAAAFMFVASKLRRIEDMTIDYMKKETGNAQS